ncbi:prepilin peptidase [Fusobacterium perfoetens]|uniref:prepilin peptidase n=1 Tax=Fusobacterium perfoetens TaxID=852 RepID=UPI001F32BF4F|nr:A24 family peptidase [Fusobacterium perfoetens]MCF2625646.1 prepilin peptidase [Fusobacterium perfoetens]
MDRIIEHIFDIFFVIFLILITLKDIKEKIIPNFFTLGIIFLGILKIIFADGDFEKSLLGLGIYPVLFIFLYGYVSDFFKKEVIGFGDIKLMGAIGFYLGYSGIYNLILLHNLIFILGFIFVTPLIILKKYKKEKEIPFAPFICIGSVVFGVIVIL